MINAWKRSRQRLLASLFSLVWLSGWAVPAGTTEAAPGEGGHDVPEPYVVYVAHEAVYTRCGPDGEFYRTDPLRLGQSLEVYLETDAGWLGVRPPENSFSWVLADDIELAPDEQSGTVVGRQVVAWIGTHLGRARKYRWQVELPQGENVAIIGETERQDGEQTETWYRIVPPSGEFRWVHRTQIVDSTEALVQMHRNRPAASGRPTPAESPAGAGTLAGSSTPGIAAADATADQADRGTLRSIVTGEENLEQAPGEDSMAALRRLDADPIGSGVAGTASTASPHAAAADAAATDGLDAGLIVGDDVRMRDIAAAAGTAAAAPPAAAPPAAERRANIDSWVPGLRPERPTASVPAGVATVGYTKGSQGRSDRGQGLRPTSPPVLQTLRPSSPAEQAALVRRCATADIDTLQLELSRQLAAGAPASLVEPIRQRAEQLVETLDDSVERGHARLLLERVDQYQRVARRRDGEPAAAMAAASSASPAGVALPAPGLPSPTIPQETSTTDEAGANGFLRVGYLVQVYSSRPHAPPYAINDASGRTLAYVSPALGVRLRSHLNQHVGLKGELKFHTGLNTPHIVANQAVPVQR